MDTWVTTEGGPFAIVPLWILEKADPQALRLYVLLAGKYADKEGYSYPSRRLLCEQLNVSKRTIDAAVHHLEHIGALIVTRRAASAAGNETNLYRVQRIALGSATDCTPLEQHTAPPLEQYTAPLTIPIGTRPIRTNGAGGAKDITDDFIDEMVGRYSVRLGGDDNVRLDIDRAMNHKNIDRAKDKRRYLVNWLRKSVSYREERESKNGTNRTVSATVDTNWERWLGSR